MKGVGGWWNKIFMEIFNTMLHGFLPFSPVSSKNSAQVSGQTCPSPRASCLDQADDVTSGRRDVDLHGRVNQKT